MDLELKNKVVVITGGSKGIGLGVGRAFAREGASLVLTARNKSEVGQAAAKIKEEYRSGDRRSFGCGDGR
jgi:NAD(P)-dependent dehydrogenase (short-subunit alcohol dehydrogenase family)